MNATWSRRSNIRARARFRWTDNRARSRDFARAPTTRPSVSGFSTPARGANGQTYSNIEVVSGLYAWNEDARGRRDRSDERQDHADGGGRAGAADPHLGKSAGRAQGRAGRDNGDILVGGQPGHAVRGRCREGARDVRVVGGGQAGRDVPDSGRSRGDRDRHPRCEVHDRARGGHPGVDDHGVHLQRLSRTGTTR